MSSKENVTSNREYARKALINSEMKDLLYDDNDLFEEYLDHMGHIYFLHNITMFKNFKSEQEWHNNEYDQLLGYVERGIVRWVNREVGTEEAISVFYDDVNCIIDSISTKLEY